MNWPKPKIGISSCLLGNQVRYDGGHKAHKWLLNQLAPFVTWIPYCPEVEMGLGVPRETMHLVGTSASSRLVTTKNNEDKTEVAENVSHKFLAKQKDLDAYIFKRDSPSCGLERVKVFGTAGIPTKDGIGIFAKNVRDKYPNITVIEEGRLSDVNQREFFLSQLFLYTQFLRLEKQVRTLQHFHQVHKIQLMAYDPSKYAVLGRFAANSEKLQISEVFQKYETMLAELIRKPLTVKKYANAFEHMLGYFKKTLTSQERKHVLKVLQDYRLTKVPLVSVTTLFRFLVETHAIDYLHGQSILNPYPEEILTGDSK